MFSPLAFPEGRVLYDLSTSLPPPAHLALTPFEVYREPLIVLGITDGTDFGLEHAQRDGQVQRNGAEPRFGGEHRELPGIESISRGLDDLSRQHPKALVHQVLVFDHEEFPLPQGVYPVPSPAKSRTTTVKTVMCDMTSRLLGAMAPYAKSLQGLTSLDSPRVSSAPTFNEVASALPSHMGHLSRVSSGVNSRSSSPAGERSDLTHRVSMPARVTSEIDSRSSTPDSRATSPPSGRNTPPPTTNGLTGASATKSPPRESGNEKARAESRDRTSTSGFGAGSLGEREKNKGKGRVGIVIGAMYLLAGRWPDAVKELVQSATIARASSDYLWHAKALDYILVCLLMFAWAEMDFRIPDTFYPGSEKPGSSSSKSSKNKQSESLAEIGGRKSLDPENRAASLQSLASLLPDLTNNILNLYSRAWTFTDDKLPPLAFSQSAIRFAKLLSVLHISGKLDDSVLRHLVLNTKLSKPVIEGPDAATLSTKPELAALAFRAYPSPLPDSSLSIADHTMILAGIASVLSELGYHRKKAIILKGLMSTLLPALVQARKDGAAEMGVHPAASLASLNASARAMPSQNSSSASDDSEQGMRHFLSLVCQAYGILPLEPIGSIKQKGRDKQSVTPKSRQTRANEATVARAIQQASINASGSKYLKLEVLRSCINVCEALPDLGGALQYSAELLRAGGSSMAPGPDSSDGSPDLPIEEQMRLANNISRTLSAARHLGVQHLEADYWDDFLVRGIEVVETNQSRALVSHAKPELEVVETIEAKKEKNPFIYNPFLKKSSAAAEPLLVAQEEAFFRVTLQNLYDFDVVIEHIELLSDSIPFEGSPETTLIGPYRTQTLLLSGTPQAAGSLSITGCAVKVKGCRERMFPIFSEPWALKPDIKGRHVGLAQKSRPISTASDPVKSKIPPPKGPTATKLALKVTGAQPNISLKSISLPQSAIMLLDGETRTFTVSFQNTSRTIPMDLVLLSFTDSTASQLQSALANKDLSPVELYELEFASARKQSFRRHRKDKDRDLMIEPGGEATFEIEVLGKPQLSHGAIQVDYGYLGIPKTDIKDHFYTRQLVIPLTITVNASISFLRNDVVSLPSDSGRRDEQATTDLGGAPFETNYPNANPSRLHPPNDNPHSPSSLECLLLLDLRNSWPSTLTISIELRSSNTPTKTQSRIFHPGTTHRIPVFVPRLHLPNAHDPIPSINPHNARQFVVSSTKSTPEAERAMREAFWYREVLLSRLHATWKQESTGRSGEVELRGLRLTPRMISALKLDDLEISMAVLLAEPHPGSASAPVKQLNPTTFTVPTQTFLSIATTLRNRSTTPIHPLLRLQPSLANQPPGIALDLGKRLLVNGVLQRVVDVIPPGEEVKIETGFVVLSKGRYEWGATVEEVRSQSMAGKGDAKGSGERGRAATGERVLEDGGRRVWYGEQPCTVVAEDTGEAEDEEEGEEGEEAEGNV
ncbi:hypothetical protein HO133_000191 [Letharia lupina]|uniref:Hypercellular protein HypA n=1 Tax=Letharia lupina TaxID=560253 RepID=A0A8H6CH08_9LECA|nr:uncharacterized protein HO133_000191 [Letharia lupina]KAF6223349.1 hypothetical protein HO133_000191 [Letharia lupina]